MSSLYCDHPQVSDKQLLRSLTAAFFLGCAFHFDASRSLTLDKIRISQHQVAAFKDLTRLGSFWRQSHYVTFCDNPLAPRSDADCQSKGLKFNATSCFCYPVNFSKGPRSHSTTRPLRSNLPIPSASNDIDSWQIDWTTFMKDADLHGLFEARCDLQLGLIVTPQPTDLSYLRYPYAFLGPACLGFSLYGTSCLPSTTKKISQEVDKLLFMSDGRYHSMATENIDLELATSCVEMCTVAPTSCLPTQVFDKSLCTCRCAGKEIKCENGLFWNVSSCRCECATSPFACGTGTVFDPNFCLCVPQHSNTPTKLLPTVKPKLSVRLVNNRRTTEDKEECDSLIVCFNSSQVPTFNQSNGTCTCRSHTQDNSEDFTKHDNVCRYIPCDSTTGGEKSAIPDADRDGCVCPCKRDLTRLKSNFNGTLSQGIIELCPLKLS